MFWRGILNPLRTTPPGGSPECRVFLPTRRSRHLQEKAKNWTLLNKRENFLFSKATSKGLSCAFAHPFSCSLAAIKKQRTLESASNSKGAGSLITDSTATCWHSISSAGASLGSSAHFGSKDFLLRRMSQQHKTRVSLVIGLDQTSHDTS